MDVNSSEASLFKREMLKQTNGSDHGKTVNIPKQFQNVLQSLMEIIEIKKEQTSFGMHHSTRVAVSTSRKCYRIHVNQSSKINQIIIIIFSRFLSHKMFNYTVNGEYMFCQSSEKCMYKNVDRSTQQSHVSCSSSSTGVYFS